MKSSIWSRWSRKRLFLFAWVIWLISALACSLPQVIQPQQSEEEIQTAVAQTVEAGIQPPGAIQDDLPGLPTEAASLPPPATLTPIVLPTVTPGQATPTFTATIPPSPVPTFPLLPTVIPFTPPVQSPLVTPNPYKAAQGCPLSLLRVGDVAYVNWVGGANGIRSTPDTNLDNVIGKAQPGESMLVVGGPVCKDFVLLWEVTTATGLRGWTPEGMGKELWVLPFGYWLPCSDARPSPLYSGWRAYVSYGGGSNRLRQEPGTGSTQVGVINEGEHVEILAGPACANGMVWWQVRSLQSSQVGWTSEGNSSLYWLVPWAPQH